MTDDGKPGRVGGRTAVAERASQRLWNRDGLGDDVKVIREISIEAEAAMIEFNDFMLVIAKPSLYDDCRGFAGVGMPRCRVGGPRRKGVLGRLGLGWLARCLFCETPVQAPRR